MKDGIDQAQARVDAARSRLGATAGALRTRLDPQAVARDAVDAVVDHGADALQSGIESARRNPAKFAGALAVISAYFARRRIGALIAKLREPKRAKHGRVPRVRSSKPRPLPAKRNST